MNTIVVGQEDSLATKLTSTNTMYVLSGNHNLDSSKIIIPKGCVLKFDYGSKITNGTLTLNNTVLEGAKHCIATEVCGVQDELDTDFFDLTLKNKTTIMQSIVDTANTIQLHGRLENVFNNIKIGNKPTTLIGNGASVVNTLNTIVTAITITSNTFVRIVDLDFNISSGYAIYKDVAPTTITMLSFMIDRCNFVSSGGSSTAIIQLLSSREGNITNCFFKGSGINGCIGLKRKNAVNTNVIGCMFSDLSYGIYAFAERTNEEEQSELYSSYACGLNVQSAVMLGCKFGIYIEGNDSFFLNNSMIDYCNNPLFIYSQDGANITNNYFSTSEGSSVYNATITIRNNGSKTPANRNKRIIISENTIYGHRTTNNYGIEMDVESEDCIIQGNTFDYFTGHGICLRHLFTNSSWTIEKLVIDNNRFHFANANADGIGGYNFTGDCNVIISNNYAAEGSDTKLLSAGSANYGNYLFFGNHVRLASTPSGSEGVKIYNASQRNHTRLKIDLLLPESVNQLEIVNPMNGDTNIVVQVANNRYPVCVYDICPDKIKFNRVTSNTDAIAFTAIIEHLFNL